MHTTDTQRRTQPAGSRLAGLFTGQAVGDALGLPAEGLPPAVIARRWPQPLRHRLVLGRGLVSDDTEHLWMTAASLLEHPEDPDAFARALARRLRWWVLGLPGGVGMATARSCLRLWGGVPPSRSGVWSAGNGPCMRSPLLGAVYATDAERRRAFVTASTKLTHADPRAEMAASTVAEAAAGIVNGRRPADFLTEQCETARSPEWRAILEDVQSAVGRGESLVSLARRYGGARGVTGFAFHTAPVALYAWLRHGPDYRSAMTEVIACGGDTDTVAAVAGALCGLDGGEASIPTEWQAGLRDFPRGLDHGRACADALVSRSVARVRWCWPLQVPRNLLFLLVVLSHGLRRLWPVPPVRRS